MRIHRTLLLITSLILAFLYSPAAAQGSDPQWLFGQVNNLRGGLGLHAYVWNDQLAAAAQQQSEYMAATGHISHTQSNGSTPTSRAAANGYGGTMIAENIYGGLMAQATDAWAFWVNSGVHYATLTNSRNNEIGIGAAKGDNGTYYALVIGYRRDVTAPPAPVPVNNSGGEAPAAPVAPAAPPPTARPPTRTFTPSPTIPTATPTITWTPTFTWTPSPTDTVPPATATGIHLPTAQVVAMLPSATQVIISVPPDEAPPRPSAKLARRQDKAGFDVQKLLPVFLVGQVLLIGVGVYSLFFRKSRLR